jgi:hypothetical protein
MAALFEGATRSPLSGPPTEVVRTGRPFDAAGVTAGLAYVSRCLRGHRSFGIITGSNGALTALLDRVTADCEAREDLHTVRIATPTDSVQTFLTSCLAQLGFELHHAALDDLHNLLIVFLRHEGARGRRTVGIIEATDQYGPRVLEFMQTLSKVRAGATPAMTFILAGSPALHRILDSPGMSALRLFTRERFDLDRSLAWISIAGKASALVGPWTSARLADAQPVATDTTPRRLVVMLDGVIIERRELSPGRVLIGRGRQCGLRLDSRYVSRHHAVLVVSTDAVVVVDLQSTNATLVNGQVTASQQLEHGDLLAIGNYRLRYDFRRR